MYNFRLNDPHFLPHIGAEIDFTITPGKLVTLVGENGIGKSTLARSVWKSHLFSSTLIEQGAMDIFYDRTLSKIKDSLIKSRQEEMDLDFFHSLWERFGLHQKESRFHSTLSGGEGQALKLAIGFSQNVSCYIVDEPSQFLDLHAKKVLSDALGELLKKNRAILLIEHDYEWVRLPNTFVKLGISQDLLKQVDSWTT